MFQEALQAHNHYSSLHIDTAPLILDAEVSQMAQAIADRQVWGHSSPADRNGYGENLAWNTQQSMIDAVKLGVKQWYDEIMCISTSQLDRTVSYSKSITVHPSLNLMRGAESTWSI